MTTPRERDPRKEPRPGDVFRVAEDKNDLRISNIEGKRITYQLIPREEKLPDFYCFMEDLHKWIINREAEVIHAAD